MDWIGNRKLFVGIIVVVVAIAAVVVKVTLFGGHRTLPPDTMLKQCSRDSQCVFVSTRCCALCGDDPGTAYNKQYKEQLVQHRKQRCAGKQCPLVDCKIEEKHTFTTRDAAVCRQGQCTTKRELACDTYCRAKTGALGLADNMSTVLHRTAERLSMTVAAIKQQCDCSTR